MHYACAGGDASAAYDFTKGAGFDDSNWDFGTGAGFYVNATQEPWSANFHMYDYVTKDLPQVGLQVDRAVASLPTSGSTFAELCAPRPVLS